MLRGAFHADACAVNKRILLVEDDYLVALDLEHCLTDAGFEVVGIARTADEALMLAALHKPALAVMDVRLAGPRDGVDAAIDLVTRLRVRSIFATAHADASIQERAAHANPLGWLQKPYSPRALVALVERATRVSPD
jgi:DNA-binding NarL/FixJ family response regulator